MSRERTQRALTSVLEVVVFTSGGSRGAALGRLIRSTMPTSAPIAPLVVSAPITQRGQIVASSATALASAPIVVRGIVVHTATSPPVVPAALSTPSAAAAAAAVVPVDFEPVAGAAATATPPTTEDAQQFYDPEFVNQMLAPLPGVDPSDPQIQAALQQFGTQTPVRAHCYLRHYPLN